MGRGGGKAEIPANGLASAGGAGHPGYQLVAVNHQPFGLGGRLTPTLTISHFFLFIPFAWCLAGNTRNTMLVWTTAALGSLLAP